MGEGWGVGVNFFNKNHSNYKKRYIFFFKSGGVKSLKNIFSLPKFKKNVKTKKYITPLGELCSESPKEQRPVLKQSHLLSWTIFLFIICVNSQKIPTSKSNQYFHNNNKCRMLFLL